MTAKRDLKRRVRQRQARTGEAYVTARRHVLAARTDAAETATAEAGAATEAETAEISAQPATAQPATAETVMAKPATVETATAETAAVADPRATAVPVTELLDVSEEARRVGLMCRVAMFPGLAERVEPASVLVRLRELLVETAGDSETLMLSSVALTGQPSRRPPQPQRGFEHVRPFVRRARAGLGGTLEDGSAVVFHVADRDGPVPIMCSLSEHDASLVLAAIDDLTATAELARARLVRRS
jgi:hypothetical protein